MKFGEKQLTSLQGVNYLPVINTYKLTVIVYLLETETYSV